MFLRHFRHLVRVASNPEKVTRRWTSSQSPKDERIGIPSVELDEVDQIMLDNIFQQYNYYPKLTVDPLRKLQVSGGHNVLVIQPWVSYANFGQSTTPDLQLDECVSLGNTIKDWQVVGKKIVFANQINRKLLFPPAKFEELKEYILGHENVSAVFFGVELLSGIQLSSLERELRMPVYDRFTVVLNIFRQHARTKESRIQLALAELPYIKSHLREIHESCEYPSSVESLKLLIGGVGHKLFHQRLDMLKRREHKLRQLLVEIRTQREVAKRLRQKNRPPTVSVVGYTNSGKTTLVKYLTEDKDLTPRDQLFATLDVSSHFGGLPSHRSVMYLDTVGFLSRIPLLLVEAFSATLMDIKDSDLIVHVLDVSHPDHEIQYETVIKALNLLKIPKNLLDTKLTIGNKVDLIKDGELPSKLPKCDMHISLTKAINLQPLVEKINKNLLENLSHEVCEIKIENGGNKYTWLRKNTTILDCKTDEQDCNYLICRVIMSPVASGRWRKLFGTEDILSSVSSRNQKEQELELGLDPGGSGEIIAATDTTTTKSANKLNDQG